MKPDFYFFKDSMLILAVIVVLSVTAVGFSYQINSRVEQKKIDVQASVQNAKNQLQHRIDEHRIIKQKKHDFLRLLAEKRFEPADRMGWIDAAKFQSKQMKLPSLKYTLNSREKFYDDALPPLDNVSVYVTPISFQIGMVHEGDLVGMFDHLIRVSSGHISAEKCQITRIAEPGRFLPTETNLRATCSLSWFNFDKSAVEEFSEVAMMP